MRIVSRTSSVGCVRTGLSGGRRKTVEPSENTQEVITENALNQPGLEDLCSRCVELHVKNRRMEKDNGRLASTLNEFRTANMNLKKI